MPTIREAADYEHCLVEMLEASGGRATRGHLYREFEKRYASSIPRDEMRITGRVGAVPRWRRALDEAALRLIERKRLYRHGEDALELT